MQSGDRDTPEHNLWFSALGLYFTDAENEKLTEQEVKSIIQQASHKYTRDICRSIDLDHKFFVEKLIKHFEMFKPQRQAYAEFKNKTGLILEKYVYVRSKEEKRDLIEFKKELSTQLEELNAAVRKKRFGWKENAYTKQQESLLARGMIA